MEINDDIKSFVEREVLPFSYPTTTEKIIKVIGVGGGGGNAVRNMYREGIVDVEFVLANTDFQAMSNSDIPIKLQLGRGVTNGLGAGNDPSVARMAAEESIEEIKAQFTPPTEMVFITAGMGGGTGTGASPVIAKCARESGMLTVGIVTIPFKFEQRPKIRQALAGVKEMAKYVDALLVISNEKLLEIYPNETIVNAFKRADEILTVATKSIAELITIRGVINLDFRDVKKILKDGGIAIMSSGLGMGENRINKALEAALHSPLLYNNDIYNSKRVLFNIYQSQDSPINVREMGELQEFMSRFKEDNDIELIWGIAYDNTLGESVKITLLATGFGMSSLPFIAEQSDGDLIDAMYGRDLCWYELDDADMENDALLDMLASLPAYRRDTSALSKIRACRKTD